MNDIGPNIKVTSCQHRTSVLSRWTAAAYHSSVDPPALPESMFDYIRHIGAGATCDFLAGAQEPKLQCIVRLRGAGVADEYFPGATDGSPFLLKLSAGVSSIGIWGEPEKGPAA